MPRDDHFTDVTYTGNLSPGETSRTLNDFVPSPDATHDLGTSTNRWKNLWLSGAINGSTSIIYADAQVGADAGAKIQAAIDALPSTGGIVDARGLNGAHTAAATITIAKSNVLILTSPCLTLTSTADPCIQIGDGGTTLYSDIWLEGGAEIEASGSVTKVVWLRGPTIASGAELQRVRIDLHIDGGFANGGFPSTTVVGVYGDGKLVGPEISGYIERVGTQIQLEGTSISDHINPRLYRLTGNNCSRYGILAKLSYNLTVEQCDIETAAGTGSPIPIAVDLQGVNGASFTNCTLASNITVGFGNPPTIQIEQGGASQSRGISFTGCYIDGDPATAGPRVNILNSSSAITFSGNLFVSVAGATSVSNLISLASTVAGFTAKGNFNYPDMKLGEFVSPPGGDQTYVATPPSTQPGSSVVLSGGSIADGTYYFKITYWNRNGETTASPTRTVTVTGGGGAARINIANADNLWGSGTYAYRTYASSDNVTFHLETPTPVASDFMATSTAHYVALGSFGTRFDSLALTGAAPPSTNTATIDPLQVALNATRNASYTAQTLGALFVPATSAGHVLTTPLIVFPHDTIMGVGAPNLYNTGQSRVTSTWTDNRLATVMIFSAAARINGIEVFGSGHAMMILSGMGTKGEQHFLHYNTIKSNDTTSTYSGLVIIGVAYDQYFDRNFIQGSKAVVEFRNVAGGLRYFNGGRWNTTKHMVLSDGAVTDPDNGVNDAGFPNGSSFWMRDIRTELGNGILFDIPNFLATLEDCEIADVVPAGGTDSVMKIGQNANGGGSRPTGLKLIRTLLPASGTYRVGIDIGYTSANFGPITIEDGSAGAGASGGSNISIDFHNITANPLTIRHSTAIGSGSNALPHLDPAATTGTLANIHAAQQISSMGAPADQGVGSLAWNEFMDRIVLRTSAARANRQSWFMNGSTIELRGTDDTTVNFSISSAGVGTWRGAVSPASAGIAHGGATNYWAYNGTIGATTARTGAFTTVTASTSVAIGAGTAITKIVVYSPSLTPASVALQTTAEQTFTVTGLTTADKVFVNGPTVVAGTGIVNARVSAADTLALTFMNTTLGALTPTSGTYIVLAMRS